MFIVTVENVEERSVEFMLGPYASEAEAAAVAEAVEESSRGGELYPQVIELEENDLITPKQVESKVTFEWSFEVPKWIPEVAS